MASSQPILLCRYGYDPLDRLINQFLAGAPEHQRFYCKSRLSTEIQGAIGYSIFQKEDLLLAQQKRQHDAVESTLLATDLQRSVLQTLNADLQHPIAYSPYGHRQTESGLSSLLGLNGERADPVTGHYLLGNGYRAFNPALMRFNSPDSLSPFGRGGLNTYAYCLGNPVLRTDPTGAISAPISTVNAMILSKKWLSKSIYSPSIPRSTTASDPNPTFGPAGNMQDIKIYGAGGQTFLDRNRTRLNVYAHGMIEKTDGQPINPNGSSVLGFVDGTTWETNDVMAHIKQEIKNNNIEQVRLISCYSARGGSDSLAAQISKQIDVPVKGYKNAIGASIYTPNFFSGFFRSINQTTHEIPVHIRPKDMRDTAMNFRINKEFGSYEPEKFNRGIRLS